MRTKEQIAEYRKAWNLANADRIREQKRQYYIDNKQAIDCRRAKRKEVRRQLDQQYHQEHKDERNAKCREYYLLKREEILKHKREHKNEFAAGRSKDAVKEAGKRYRKTEKYVEWVESTREYRNSKNRERWPILYAKKRIDYIARNNKRRALMSGTYVESDILELYNKQLALCPGCNDSLDGKYEIDHIVPLAIDPLGDRLENIQLLCRKCNRSKGARTMIEWIEWKGQRKCA